jgi:hypothetical protein
MQFAAKQTWPRVSGKPTGFDCAKKWVESDVKDPSRLRLREEMGGERCQRSQPASISGKKCVYINGKVGVGKTYICSFLLSYFALFGEEEPTKHVSHQRNISAPMDGGH